MRAHYPSFQRQSREHLPLPVCIGSIGSNPTIQLSRYPWLLLPTHPLRRSSSCSSFFWFLTYLLTLGIYTTKGSKNFNNNNKTFCPRAAQICTLPLVITLLKILENTKIADKVEGQAIIQVTV